MNIKDIYSVLAQHGFVSSQVQFSEVWLGRSKRYSSSLLAKGREPGTGAMIGLAMRLRNVGEAMVEKRPDLAQLLCSLGETLIRDVQRQCLTAARRPSGNAASLSS